MGGADLMAEVTSLPIDEEIDDIVSRFSGDELTEDQRRELDQLLLSDARRVAFGMMRRARQRRAEVVDLQSHLAMVSQEVQRAIEPKMREVEWLERQLEDIGEVLLVGKSKTVTLPGAGRIAYADHQPKMVIEDDETFIAALDREERAVLVEDRPHLRRNDAKAYAQRVLEATGEVVPGAIRVPGQRTASIRYEEELS